ncbi:3444_t:CDS:1, partial [Funneliformis geosporum]
YFWARILKVPKSTVTDTIVRHFDTNNGSSVKRAGRPLSMNDNDRCTLKRLVKKNNRSSLSEIHNNFQNLKALLALYKGKKIRKKIKYVKQNMKHKIMRNANIY